MSGVDKEDKRRLMLFLKSMWLLTVHTLLFILLVRIVQIDRWIMDQEKINQYVVTEMRQGTQIDRQLIDLCRMKFLPEPTSDVEPITPETHPWCYAEWWDDDPNEVKK